MPMPEKMITRHMHSRPEFRVEGEDAKRSITGYAAVFDTETDLGWFAESIAKGSFAESIARKDDVRALFNHDPSLILGRSTAGTLELWEDDTGLACRIFPPDTQVGRDLLVSIERGDVSQMSFGFWIDAEERRYDEGDKPHYTITRATLFDVSPVTFPAYESTSVEVERHVQDRLREIREASAAAAHAYRSRQLALRARTLR